MIGGVFLLLVPKRVLRARERAKPWYMQDAFNKEDHHLTVLNLSGAVPQGQHTMKSK
jgi:hypothetical protein